MKRKTVFIVLGCVAAVIVAIVGLVWYATSGMTAAADKFFATARNGEPAEVYAMTSAELHNATSSEQLASFIQANRFDQVAETSWSSRSIKNGLGSLEGSLTLDDGGVIPLSLQLVKEGGDWKVSFIELREAGLSGGAGPQTGGGDVPPENVVLNTVRFHTNLLFEAAQREDEAGWQSSLEYLQPFFVDGATIAQLEELVTPMRNLKDGVEIVSQSRQPVVERTSPAANGGFQAAGYYEVTPWRYDYDYTFIPDGDDWKLGAVDYELNKFKLE